MLLVEDNPLNARLMAALMQALPCGHELAMNGAQAAEKLVMPFDLILMDVELPDANGFEIIDSLRRGDYGESNRTTPVIAISAHAADELERECTNRTRCALLPKPVSLNSLREVFVLMRS